jgi:hypothetical protein
MQNEVPNLLAQSLPAPYAPCELCDVLVYARVVEIPELEGPQEINGDYRYY